MDILKLYQEAKEKGIDFEIRTDYFMNTLVIEAAKGTFHIQEVLLMDEVAMLNFPVENRIESSINKLIYEVDKNEK